MAGGGGVTNVNEVPADFFAQAFVMLQSYSNSVML